MRGQSGFAMPPKAATNRKKVDSAVLKNVLFKNLSQKALTKFLVLRIFSLTSTAIALIFQSYLLTVFPGLNILIIPIILAAANARLAGSAFGLISIFISTFALLYFFLPARGAFAIENPESLMQLVLFLAASFTIVLLIEKSNYSDELRKTKKREKELTNLLEIKTLENEKAQNDIRARDEFLSVVSHELKTPLTTMLLEVQQALYNIRNVSLANFSVPNLLKKLEDAEQQTKKLSKMINDLLNASLITTGQMQIDREKVNLTTLVKNKIKQLSGSSAANHQIILKVKDNVEGYWDKVRLDQAITNILSNALKYGEGKKIETTIRKSGSKAQIQVEDHGIGIAKEEQKAIFSKFHRAPNGKNHKGLGIGLYVTSQIVDAHNGKIKVKSKPKKGTTLTVELPIKNK